MGNQRAGFDLNSDDAIDIGEFTKGFKPSKKPTPEQQKQLIEEGEKLGFVSRQPQKRRVKPKSPYVVQNNFKTRHGMKELFQEIGARLEVFDQSTFELAILALLEKKGMTDLIEDYKKLVK